MKFYTTKGDLDIVGNNTPIFFIRDAIQFPDFIPWQKCRPDAGLRDHHMQWEVSTQMRAFAHQVTYLMGDQGFRAPGASRTVMVRTHSSGSPLHESAPG